MKILLDLRKTALQNAQALFGEAKKFRRKAEGARKAIEETKRRMGSASEDGVGTGGSGGAGAKGKRKWFDEYRHFATSGGFLCVGGKNAKQNDTLVASQLKEGDLFFHADVHGASAVVLKNGLKAGEKDKREAAQFAACYSNAWKLGSGVADVYCVTKDQVSKHSHGEFVGKGAFLVSGEKRWFKNVELRMVFAGQGEALSLEPAEKLAAKVGGMGGTQIRPGGSSKEELFKELKFQLKLKKSDRLFSVLPGNSAIV